MEPAGHGAPDPEQACSSVEFIAQLQALKDWSGLTYRELTTRAEAVGDVLPRSTVANMLNRTTVPREELVAAFVRACGCGPGATDAWLRVRKELTRRERQSGEVPDFGAVEGAQEAAGSGDVEPGPGTEEPAPPEPPRRTWLTRAVRPAVVVLALAVAAVTVTLAVRDTGPDKGEQSDGQRKKQGLQVPPRSPEPGSVRIRAVDSGLCIGERAEDGPSGQLYQLACVPDTIPRFALRPVEPGWRIVTFHPEFGEGCSGVQEKSRDIGAPVVDQECGKRGPAEAFRLEAVGKPVRGYRLRPLHSDLCAGVRGAPKETGAPIEQQACAKDAQGQLFTFDRDPTAGKTNVS
ncbi:hypothetical protein OG883_06045 [Streptomyces sp. NBC_01142]|uniref:RICIN domain-containing protein n=1 Tax=Streptomyces sp. NBC_01142 TaxID=2975865 RepID=UPI0022511F43|nr:helix-turn-helix domain-containing protein [Streptomyces sp. NBC_01142]MCX4819475.1 hypothetical protein [Streptomyces sp. NBC_01142]